MGGDKPIGLAIGMAVLAILVLLPALIVPTYYLFANVYALITGSDFSSNTMNVAVTNVVRTGRRMQSSERPMVRILPSVRAERPGSRR